MNLYDEEIVNSPSGFVKEKIIEYILSRANRVEFLVEVRLEMPIWYYFSAEIKNLFKANLIKANLTKAAAISSVS